MKAALLLVALALAGCAVPAEMVQERLLPDAAPPFEVRTVDGEVWNLTAQRGKTVLVDVMAVDCAACDLQTPVLREVAAQRAGEDFAMISVEMGTAFPGWGAEDEGTLLAYREEQGLTWPIASDGNGTVFRDYHVLILPTLIIIRPDGTIHETLLGERSVEEIQRAVDGASLPR